MFNCVMKHIKDFVYSENPGYWGYWPTWCWHFQMVMFVYCVTSVYHWLKVQAVEGCSKRQKKYCSHKDYVCLFFTFTNKEMKQKMNIYNFLHNLLDKKLFIFLLLYSIIVILVILKSKNQDMIEYRLLNLIKEVLQKKLSSTDQEEHPFSAAQS